MTKILIVVDMQNDFITGALGTPEARGIVQRVVQKVEGFWGNIICTKDTHYEDYLSTQEGMKLPVAHCLLSTPGHDICPELMALDRIRFAPVFSKETFASVELVQMLQSYLSPIEEIELVGVCTDICVVSNALMLKSFLPNIPIVVDASCCAGVTPETHAAALETMRSCQIEIRNEVPGVLEQQEAQADAPAYTAQQESAQSFTVDPELFSQLEAEVEHAVLCPPNSLQEEPETEPEPEPEVQMEQAAELA